MRRVAAIVEYDGSNFFGYQGQPDVRTVQGVIEDALERIFKQRIYTQAAGRTDAGVHANGQLIAFNCPNDRMTTEDIKNAMNANLPDDVYVKKVFEVPKNFHPRFDVKKRIYHYFIHTSREKNVFLRKYAWWFPYELDLEAMRKAAKYLEGTHDFTSFKTGSDERDPVRTIYRIRILSLGKDMILIRVEGRSFLRRMVRNIVAALVKVGLRQWEPEKLKEVLEARDRSAAAGTAPAHGLYFLQSALLMFAFDYRIEENGVLYFLGDATPTEVELEIVQEWKDLPVVTLVYDGPDEYEGLVENLLSQDGVLTGVGTPLIVKLRVKEDLVAFQVVFEDKELDNFENPVTSNLFPEQFRETVRKIFPQLEVPSRFFLIEYRDGKFEKKIAQTRDFPGKKAPVVIIPVWKQKHVLEIGNYREVVDEGFYQIGGKTIYVGRDISLKSVPGLYEGVDMVFLDGEKEYIYKDGFLRMEEKVLKVQEPVDVVDGKVITGYRIGEQEVDDTVLFRWNDFVLTASGVLIGINGSWTWQVSRAPVEFSFRDGRMYILDVCGFLRSYDLKTRRLLWERRIEGAWGLDTSRDRVFVGAGSNVVVLNAEDGETIEILEADDFAVWKDELLIYRDGKINGESVGDGFFIRNFGTPLFVSEGKVLFFGSVKKIYRNVEKIRVFQWGTVIKEGNELWLIRRD